MKKILNVLRSIYSSSDTYVYYLMDQDGKSISAELACYLEMALELKLIKEEIEQKQGTMKAVKVGTT